MKHFTDHARTPATRLRRAWRGAAAVAFAVVLVAAVWGVRAPDEGARLGEAAGAGKVEAAAAASSLAPANGAPVAMVDPFRAFIEKGVQPLPTSTPASAAPSVGATAGAQAGAGDGPASAPVADPFAALAESARRPAPAAGLSPFGR